MDTPWLLMVIFMVITSSEYSDTAEYHCEDLDLEPYNLLEGEAFYIVPYGVSDNESDEFLWYKNSSQIDLISTNETESVHFHRGKLFMLNLTTENSGFYTLRQKQSSGKCYNHHVKVEVFREKMAMELLYVEIHNSDVNKKIVCPDTVCETCETFEGKLTWMKDFIPIQGHEKFLWVYNSTKSDEGIYTCACTWTYNHKVYKSSGSRRLRLKDIVVPHKPEIIPPTNKELFAEGGSEIKLKCSVYCGINVEDNCDASWYINEIPSIQKVGYNQTKNISVDSLKNTFSTAILSIESVSSQDFQTEFKCVGKGTYEEVSQTFTLKRRDERVYDAYVVYQTQSMDKATEDRLCQFITKTLPYVLEEKCGYRLFIHGRDDTPGEDHLQLVEDCMKESKRLMVILTPCSGSEITDQRNASGQGAVIGGFAWQLGLHHALIQREMNVILIQLGDIGPEGYTHLPLGLQHLIRKSAPIRWPEGSRDAAARNSRFWKRVRYLMPAIPAKRTQKPLETIIGSSPSER
uniref:interleukin-1 receptor type 1-like isoform X2 n=1 Tax=Scatophagus argus TaxID=75038 RepID=UPI001ED7FD32|nr:interleukin-1 receptor type 1-like isoform X2 [Scatophagus argus]